MIITIIFTIKKKQKKLRLNDYNKTIMTERRTLASTNVLSTIFLFPEKIILTNISDLETDKVAQCRGYQPGFGFASRTSRSSSIPRGWLLQKGNFSPALNFKLWTPV